MVSATVVQALLIAAVGVAVGFVQGQTIGGADELPAFRRGVVWSNNLNGQAPEDMLDSIIDAMIPMPAQNHRKKRQASGSTSVGYKAQIQQLYNTWLTSASSASFSFSPAVFNSMLTTQLTNTYTQLLKQKQDPKYKVNTVLETLSNANLSGTFTPLPYESKVGAAFPALLDKYSPCFCPRASSNFSVLVIYDVRTFSVQDLRTIVATFAPALNTSAFDTNRLQTEAVALMPRCSNAPAVLNDSKTCSLPRSVTVRNAESSAWLNRSKIFSAENDYDAALAGFAVAVWLNSAASSNVTDLVQSALFANVRFALAFAQLQNKNLTASSYLNLRVLMSQSLAQWANVTAVDSVMRRDLLYFSRQVHRDARVFAYTNQLPLPDNLTLPINVSAAVPLANQILSGIVALNFTLLKACLQTDEEIVRLALPNVLASKVALSQYQLVVRDSVAAYYKLKFGDIKPQLDAAYVLFSSALWRGAFPLPQLVGFISDSIAFAYNTTRTLAAYNSLPPLQSWLASVTELSGTTAQLPDSYIILNTVVYARGVAWQKREDAIRQNVFGNKTWKAKDAVFDHYDMLESAATYEELAFALLDATNWCVFGLQNEKLTVAEKYAYAQMAFTSLRTIWRIINIYEVPTRYHIAYWAYRFAYLAGQYGGSASDSLDCATYFNMTVEYASIVSNLVPPKICIAEAVPARITWSLYYNKWLDSLVGVSFELRQVTNASLYYQRMVDKLLHLQNISADRQVAMTQLLGERSEAAQNVEFVLNSPYVSFVNGWFKPTAQLAGPLASGGFSSLRGVSFDLVSGNFTILADVADSKNPALFNWDDVSVAFRVDPLVSADPLFFSLDSPSEKPWYYYHPYQVFRYQPASIKWSSVLDTLFRTDYILKQLTSGVEVNAKAPFQFRNLSTDGLYSGMSATLRNAIRPLYARTNSTWSSRIWLQADDVQYTVTQSGNLLNYIFGDVKMTLRTQPLQYTATGVLQDSSTTPVNDVVAQFCADFQANYKELSTVLPEFRRLNEITKMFSLRNIMRSYAQTLDNQIALGTSSTAQLWRQRKANFVAQVANAVRKATGTVTSWTQSETTWVPAAFNSLSQTIVYGGLFLNPGYTANALLQYPGTSYKYSVPSYVVSPPPAYPKSYLYPNYNPSSSYSWWSDFQSKAASPYQFTYASTSGPSSAPSGPTYSSRFSADTVDRLTRVIFGEARGESETGQKAVTNVILNRFEDPVKGKFRMSGTTDDAKVSSLLTPSQFETLANAKHDASYQAAKQQNSPDYVKVRAAVDSVLQMTPSQRVDSDPTRVGGRPGATNFDTSRGSSGIASTKYWESNNDPVKIDNQFYDYYKGPK